MDAILKPVFSRENKYKIILFFVLSIGVLLRIYRLGVESLFVDEAMVAWKSSASIKEILRFWLSGGHFPTYFIIMDYWIKVFGSGEFALRFPSAVFGVLSIYLVFLLGKKIFDERTGLLASYLFATSVINIYYSQCARPYSMALFFVLLSFFFFLEALERNTRGAWFRYSIFTLTALLTSTSTLPVLLCQIIFVYFSWERYRGYITTKRIMTVYALILFIYLPFLSRLILPNFRDYRSVPLSFLSPPSPKQVIDISKSVKHQQPK